MHTVGRRLHDEQLPSPERVAVRDGYANAPDYPYVLETFGCVRVDPASIERLDAVLGERPVSLLHFICHGAASTTQPRKTIISKQSQKENRSNPEQRRRSRPVVVGAEGLAPNQYCGNQDRDR